MNTTSQQLPPMFLFGSYTSSMPKVSDVTKAVLTSEYAYNGLSWEQAEINNPINAHDDSKVIKMLLKLLTERIAYYQQCTLGDVNYEEIAHLLSQLSKETGTRRNPAIGPFLTKIEEELLKEIHITPALAGKYPQNSKYAVNISDVIRATLNWITWIGFDQLVDYEKNCTPDDLKIFFRALEVESHSVTICTLNHDTKTEEALDQLQQSYSDGFEPIYLTYRCQGQHTDKKGSAYKFNPIVLSQKAKTKLLKLHGSINWFWKENHIYKIDQPDRQLLDDSNLGAPRFIAGTLNKMEDYTLLHYPWVWAEFQNQLLQTRRIICSGYGFTDLGVTTRLSGWLKMFPNARLCIIAPEPKSEKGLITTCQNHSIDVVHYFFREQGEETEHGERYQICSTDAELISSAARIVILDKKFEDASKHAKALRTFAYGTT